MPLKLKNTVDATQYSEAVKEIRVPSLRDENGANLVPASAVFMIDPTKTPIQPYGSFLPTGRQFSIQANATAIGVLINVTKGYGVIIDSLCVDITATATVGNRLYFAYIADTNSARDWVGAQSAAVTANQKCAYDINFGGVGAATTTLRTALTGLANVNVAVREYCPIKALENSPSAQPTLIGFSNANGFSPQSISIVDVNSTDAADSVLWRMTGRIYQGVL